MDIVGKKYLYFLFSLIVIIPGLVSLFLFGLNLSIDFTGGTRITVSLPKQATQDSANKVKNILEKEKKNGNRAELIVCISLLPYLSIPRTGEGGRPTGR